MDKRSFKSNFKRVAMIFCFIFATIGIFLGMSPAQNVKAATVGKPLDKYEAGWQRYNYNDSKIKYIGTGWFHYAGGNDNLCLLKNNPKVNFMFYGTKLRILDYSYNNRATKVNVIIDGIQVGTFNETTIASKYTLVYENNGLTQGAHTVELNCDGSSGDYLSLSALDIDSTGYLIDPNSVTGMKLDKDKLDLNVAQTGSLIATISPDNATDKNIKWTSSDSTIATVDSTGKVTALKVGTATITATTQDGTNLSASCIVTVKNPLILNIETEKDKINVNETVSANVVIDNITNIAAEDIRIKYDATKLQFDNMEEVDGIKLVKSQTNPGELRVIVASKGASNIVNAKKVLLKLNFKGIAKGEALVDVTKGRVSDGITTEQDLTDENCGQATITIENSDVNNSGEFTLLDLAIDARHYGEDPSTLSQYNTDIVVNNAIDDADLLEISNQMLLNSNYTF